MANNYKDTLQLPKTNFPMKAQLSIREPEIQSFWERIDVYKSLRETRDGAKPFVVHDGPPYANGHIHVGHAQGHVTKDVITRCHNMMGENALYVPGWDCHGLPIEWKIEEKYRARNRNKDDIPILDFRRECREFAQIWVDIQRSEFKRMGVQGDWKNAYVTMAPTAESSITRELYKFVANGSLYRNLRPVLWSVVEKTALAEAEAEYEDKESPTVFAEFKIKSTLDPSLEDASLIIWTTTPWTLPANRGIAYGEDVLYCLVELIDIDAGQTHSETNRRYVIAAELVESVLRENNVDNFEILSTFRGANLAGTICSHPLVQCGYEHEVPLFAAPFVTTDQGTGLVHMAPAYGVEEFDLNLTQNLGMEVAEILDDGGRYTENVPLFSGLHIFEAEKEIFNALSSAGALFGAGTIMHSYPHSWRSKAPLIYRATPQWFISMETSRLRSCALKAIEDTRWIPENGKGRIKDMVSERPDWCISRQRAWGVPLAIFVDKSTGRILDDPSVRDRILRIFAEEGSDAWYESDASRFLGEGYNSLDYEQIFDVLDVWFESGCTHAFVLDDRPDQFWPADLYLEGTDQHRGWFQSSLLESCGTRGTSPYRTVVTHGFVNDSDGRKMSKSKGNVVSPINIADKYGADIFRLWAISVDWTNDMRISDEILQQVAENYRRFRNTYRFILGNLYDFSAEDEACYDQMPNLEKWILNRIYQLDESLQHAVKNYEFGSWVNDLYLFCHQDLSAFYFEIRKDLLYCAASSDSERKSCQTVLKKLYICLTRWLAPVLVFTTEEIFLCEEQGDGALESIHLDLFPNIPAEWCQPQDAKNIDDLIDLRKLVNQSLEDLRVRKVITKPSEAILKIYSDQEIWSQANIRMISEVCGVSDTVIEIGEIPTQNVRMACDRKFAISLTKAEGYKCERCWKVTVRERNESPVETLCDRCQHAVELNLLTA